MGTTDSDLETAAQIAKRLAIKKYTVLDCMRQGRIPAVRLSPNCVRFNAADVLKALGVST